MYTYLKEQADYEERYDRHTVERCRWQEEPRPMDDTEFTEEDMPTVGQIQWCYDFATDSVLFQIVGDRYLDREKTIETWIEQDGKRDAMLKAASAPRKLCSACGEVMKCIHTHLNFAMEDNDHEWVEFFLACKPCKQSMQVNENGNEIPHDPPVCIKCQKEVECDTETRDGKRYYIDTCKHCGHVEETLSMVTEDNEPTNAEIEKFEYDKKRFCLTDQQGKRYINWKEQMKLMDKEKEEHDVDTELYDRLAEVKKLNIAKLEKKLKSVLKKDGFIDFSLSMPTPDREIIVEFSVRDEKDDREDNDSRKTLQKTIEEALDNTNWSLMPQSMSYRLGMLSGRLRGYESEEDLEELTKKRMKKKKTRAS